MFFFSLAGAVLNAAINILLCQKLGIPLYLDTVLTISVTLNSGLLCGVLTGVFTNIILHSLSFWGWEGYLFAICNIATALISYLFVRLFPRELNLLIAPNSGRKSIRSPDAKFTSSSRLTALMDRVIVLILLSFSLCISISILGGLITVFINSLRNNPELNPASMVLSSTMFGQNVPLIIKEIMSRIPINIIDRLVSAFGAYGLAYLVVRWSRPKSAN